MNEVLTLNAQVICKLKDAQRMDARGSDMDGCALLKW